MEVILREDIENSAPAARWSRSPPATPAISCCRSGWPSRPPNPTRRSWSRSARRTCARSERQERSAGSGQADDGCHVTIPQKAGENDQLFGSVTAKDIAEALEAQKFHVDRRKIQLDEPIRTLGEHKVTVRLHRDVTTHIKVMVEPE